MKSKNGNVLLIAVVVIAIALIGITGYLLYQNQQLKQQQSTPENIETTSVPPISTSAPSPTIIAQPTQSIKIPNDSTADWKTYTNTKYNYQLKYPNDFKITEESSNSVRVSNNLPPDPNCKGGGCNLEIPKLSIYFQNLNNPGENTISLDEYANSRRTSALQNSNNVGNIEKIQKFGLDVRYFDDTSEGYNENYLMKPKPDISFAITVIFPSKETVPIYKNISDQILSTFKFEQ